MTFDKNQTEFPSQHHERIWEVGCKVMPLEISTAEINDAEMFEGLRQIYDAVQQLYADIYEDLEKYLSKETKVKYIYSHEDFEYLRDEFFLEHQKTLRQNIDRIKYPLFEKYYDLFEKASINRKSYISGYLLSLNFRILGKRDSKKIEDTVRPMSDINKAFAMEIHNYMLAKGIKPRLHAYCNMRYQLDGKDILQIDHSAQIYMRILQNYGVLTSKVEELPNKNELHAFINKCIRYCNLCSRDDTTKPRCIKNMAKVRAGEQNVLCRGDLYIKRNYNNGDPARDAEMAIIKQLIDIRIDSLQQ